jgi:UDP-2,3-diacylglucosamine hydrolase
MHQSSPIGIVAGWGNYPLSVAKALKTANQSVVVAALDHHTDPSISRWADQLSWMGVAKLGAHQRLFQKHGVKRVVLAGKLFKEKMLFHGRGWVGLMPDFECLRAFFHIVITRRDDSRDDSLMMAIVNSYQRKGIEIVPGTEYAPELLAKPGILTRTRPSRTVQKDIEFGWRIAKQMGGLDIGQSITVRDQAVLAVEAVEGTDACIMRTATLCPRGGFTLIKVAKPQQDRRFDQPTIGTQTIDRLKRSGGRAIAIEAGETIIVDREEVIRQADAAGIAIVSLSSNEMQHAS